MTRARLSGGFKCPCGSHHGLFPSAIQTGGLFTKKKQTQRLGKRTHGHQRGRVGGDHMEGQTESLGPTCVYCRI